MDPVTITFPGFRNLCASKTSGSTPLSTDCVIVFPLNRKNKFSRTIYSSAMTQGRASSDDVNQVFTLLEHILVRLPTKFSFFMSFIFRYFLPFVVLLSHYGRYTYRSGNYDYRGNYQGSNWEYVTFDDRIWGWFTFYCVAGIAYMLFDRRRKVKQVKADVEELIKMVQPGYLKRGLRWRVPDESYSWVELIKEYRTDEESSAPIRGVQEVEKVKSQYEPPKEASEEAQTTISYPPIDTYELSAPQQ